VSTNVKGSVYFAWWGQSYVGAILPLVEHSWLRWSHDKYDTQRDNGLVLMCRAGVGNLFTIMSCMNCALSLMDCKIKWFYPKIIPLFNYEEEWRLLTYYLSTCLSWSFVLTRCCTLNWVTKILMWAMLNVHTGCRFPTPGLGLIIRV